MTEEFKALMRQAVEPELHRKILRALPTWWRWVGPRAPGHGTSAGSGPGDEPGGDFVVPDRRRVPGAGRDRRD